MQQEKDRKLRQTTIEKITKERDMNTLGQVIQMK